MTALLTIFIVVSPENSGLLFQDLELSQRMKPNKQNELAVALGNVY